MIEQNLASKASRLVAESPAMRASMREEWNIFAAKALDKAVADFDITTSPVWNELQELSSNTIVDGIFPYAESTMFQDGHFIVPATVGVTLNYGKPSDHLDMTDSFPADIVFDVLSSGSERKVKIISINVDTRSFFK
jgi:Predicted pPIWI-associating nuclease